MRSSSGLLWIRRRLCLGLLSGQWDPGPVLVWRPQQSHAPSSPVTRAQRAHQQHLLHTAQLAPQGFCWAPPLRDIYVLLSYIRVVSPIISNREVRGLLSKSQFAFTGWRSWANYFTFSASVSEMRLMVPGLHLGLQEPIKVPNDNFGHSHRACARSSTASSLGRL